MNPNPMRYLRRIFRRGVKDAVEMLVYIGISFEVILFYYVSFQDISQPSVSKVVAQKSPACDVGKKKSPNEKNVCNEDDILSSKANDKAMIFHSARSVSDPVGNASGSFFFKSISYI